MKVVSTEALTKLIQLVKSAFVKVDDTVAVTEIDTATVTEIDTEVPSLVTLATVATSGSYNDLSNKPTIPSEVTESTVSGWGFTKNTGTVTSVNNVSPSNGNVTLSIPTTTSSVTSGSTAALTSGGAYTALQSYQTTANLVTSVSSSSTDSQYPSAKLFYDTVGDIESAINTIRGV